MSTGIVVACGPSLALHHPSNLTKSGAVTVGMNDAFVWAGLTRLDYLCILHHDWFARYPNFLAWYAARSRLRVLTREDQEPISIGVAVKSNKGVSYFSFDISEGFYTGNATSFALQWAVSLGLNPIYILGLDLHGDHGTSSRKADQHNLNKQKQHFKEAAPLLKAKGIEVYNCNPDSACEAFEYRALPIAH